MNKRYKKQSIIVLLAVVILNSCDLQEVNENKNNPSEIPLAGLLPSAEVALAYNVAADFSIRTSVFMQQISGIGGFAVNDDKYNLSTNDFNNAWGNAYTKVLNNISVIIKRGDQSNAPHFAGIGRILTALTLGTLTDVYGAIPYESALNANQLAPSYEGQEAIYNKIQLLLDTAISNLQQGAGTFAPGGSDIVFNGDVNKWIAAAWTLKARYALHLSKRNPQQSAQQALNYLYDNNTYRGIKNNDGDIQVVFGTSNNQASPWFTQNAGRPGWYGMGGFFIDLLNGNPPAVPIDPRRAAFAHPRPAPAPPNTYIGAKAGVAVAASNIVGPNTFYGRANSPVSILNFPEAKFIEAEARLLLDENDPKIHSAVTEAVRASFIKVTTATDTFASGAKQDEYLTKRVNIGGSFSQKLETIITQKYIALFLNPEVWVDFRRTGYPRLEPAIGGATALNASGAIPRRFPYPNSELTLNPNIPEKSSNLQTPKLWWDQ